MQVVHAPGAGCYGHNGSDDAALEAALVARAFPGRAVLLKWSREDEHAWEPYGPAMRLELRADIDRGGSIGYWSHETYSDTHVLRSRSDIVSARPQTSSLRRATSRIRCARPSRRRTSPRTAGIHRNATPAYAFPETRIVKHLVH